MNKIRNNVLNDVFSEEDIKNFRKGNKQNFSLKLSMLIDAGEKKK